MAGQKSFFNTKLNKTTPRLSAFVYFAVRRHFREYGNLASDKQQAVEAAYRAVAADTGLPYQAVKRLCFGQSPTLEDIECLHEHGRWDIFALLGIDRRVFNDSMRVVFDELGIDEPTPADRAMFHRLFFICYQDLHSPEECPNATDE